ncbi:MAG: alpha/beta fold hydrolase [Chloroflexota bacterium]
MTILIEFQSKKETDYHFKDFQFKSGETLKDLRIHVTTIGRPQKNGDGIVTNAVLIMHGTGGQGTAFLRDHFANELFQPGQLLDAEKHFIILPDGIGHGRSSKPSDGLEANFPKYGYDDMVKANYRLLTEHLGVNHLKLVTGTSMGGMHSWVWGYTYPDFMDAIMPLASLPVEIAGRNRMTRRMIMDAITLDPTWQNGNYTAQPAGLRSAIYTLLFMTSVPLLWQQQAPTQKEADIMFDELVNNQLNIRDANDLLYQFQASWDYNPEPHLHQIKAPLLAINSADDQVNPPELKILEEKIERVKNGRFVLLPISEKTRGHGSHSWPALWKHHLEELLKYM